MAILEFNNVSKIYQQGENEVHALQDVSLTVEQGEFIAVIGPSGSGKSTFLSIAGALLHPTKGDVILNGKNLNSIKPKDLINLRLHEIGFIFQTSNLIPYLNVLDQLLVVKRLDGKETKEDKQFAVQLLQELGLGEKLKNSLNSYQGRTSTYGHCPRFYERSIHHSRR